MTKIELICKVKELELELEYEQKKHEYDARCIAVDLRDEGLDKAVQIAKLVAEKK